MAKRANGEGSVRQRANGRWEARWMYLDPTTGKTARRSFYGATQREARAALKDAQGRVAAGRPAVDAKSLVGDWVSRWCETSLAVSGRKDSTKSLYRTLARTHLVPPAFGSIPLGRLRPSDVEALVLTMRTATREDGRRAFADSTIRTVYTVLRQALDGAVRDGLLAVNPCAAVKRPGVERHEARYLTAGEVRALLDAAGTSRHARALRLIALSGMRRGEVLGLRWDDVDLEVGVVRVRGTLTRGAGGLKVTEPKTDRSRRTIPLSPAAVALLREQRKEQLRERMEAANVWIDADFVFTTEHGGPVDPRNLLRVVKAAAKRAGIVAVGVHSLRHSAAVALLEGGVNIKAVSDILGHSSVAITGDVYGHTTDDAARAAVSVLDAAMGS